MHHTAVLLPAKPAAPTAPGAPAAAQQDLLHLLQQQEASPVLTQQAATAAKHQSCGPATAQHKVVQEVAMQPCRLLHLLCNQQLQDQ
jgi:hypothetical protein